MRSCNEGKTAKSKVLIYDKKDSLNRPLNQEFEIIPIDFLQPKKLVRKIELLLLFFKTICVLQQDDFLSNPNVGNTVKKGSAISILSPVRAADADSDDDNAVE